MVKVDNGMLKELFNLENEVRKRQKRIAEIKDLCKQKGSFSTKEFICSVNEVEREYVGPIEMVLHIFGREAFETAGVLHKTKYLTVRTSRKGIAPSNGTTLDLQ